MSDNIFTHTLNEKFASFIADFISENNDGKRDFHATLIDADGSQRIFLRITHGSGEKSIIAVKNPPLSRSIRRENRAYLKIGKHLLAAGAPVPLIHKWDLENGWFLLEDLGDQKLQEAALYSKDPLELYTRVLEVLFETQTKGAAGFDTGWCCQTERYDPFLMRRFESDYFRDSFLCGYLELQDKWTELEQPFDYLAKKSARAGTHFFLHRDFQSRNILVRDGRLGIVDWQGGRMGPLGYDVASLLIDPYSGLSKDRRRELLTVYEEILRDRLPDQAGLFKETYPYLAIQRNLQILGAFSFLSRNRGKAFFEAFIPPALDSLINLVRDMADPGLLSLEKTLQDLPRPWEDRS